VPRRATPETCLAALRPNLAAEWHLDHNGELTPADVLPGSNKIVWWSCHVGHEWESKVIARDR
jgi:hypothetical protein